MKKILTTFGILSLALILLWKPWAEKPLSLVNKPILTPAPLPPLPEPVQEALQLPDSSKNSNIHLDIPPAEIQRILDAIDNLEFSFRDYAAALGGNPVGTNAEITAALLGDNSKQLRLTIPEGSTMNKDGELCDPWGSAWFFHQLSGTKMEIHSAGPDHTLYTADDFVR